MLTVKTFEFNGLGVNTYVLSNENNECIIVDPGCYSKAEQKRFDDFLETSKLKIEKIILTHCHVDHILGVTHLQDKFGLGVWIHPEGKEFLRASMGYASVLGFEMEKIIEPTAYINEGDQIFLGNEKLDFLYTPGHADGSICILSKADKFVITGDVLFRGSIGRYDFPSGDYDVLMSSIKTKLFTLDDTFIVYPGHGPITTIGYEKKNNPFIK